MCVCGIVTPHSLAVLGVAYGVCSMFWPIPPSVLFIASIRFELKPISGEFPRTLHNNNTYMFIVYPSPLAILSQGEKELSTIGLSEEIRYFTARYAALAVSLAVLVSFSSLCDQGEIRQGDTVKLSAPTQV
jgi:hypothetical protein